MPIEILMPALSPTMTEGVLVKWCKAEGDVIKPGDAIAEIETDKATMDVEAADEGTLGRILVPAGTKGVKINSVIALLLEKGEDKSVLDGFVVSTAAGEAKPEAEKPAEAQQAASQPVSTPAPTSTACGLARPATANEAMTAAGTMSGRVSGHEDGGRKFASPLAKRIASQNNLDITTIEGTGPHGRVIKVDVLAAMQSGVGSSRVASAAGRRNQPLAGPVGGHTKAEISRLRQIIANKMCENKQQAPHFYLSVDYDMGKLLEMRADVNKIYSREGSGGRKLSVTDLIVKAMACAFADLPEANVAWHNTYIARHNSVDAAVAVSVDGGVFTPIVRDAGRKSVFEISAELEDLIARVRSGKIKPDELSGGSFTISNLGMAGVDRFSAILNSPQSFIFAVGATKKVPVVRNDALAIGQVMNVTASCDHRVIDGLLAAQVMSKIKEYIENPVMMLV